MADKSAAIMLTVALAGQPNVGKSTVFNALTGLNQHVGNWPGKTVEQKTGYFTHRSSRVEIVDLPGTYSLTSGSEEERVARDFLIKEPPDVVVAIVNASCLERNLYLVGELLSLPVPLVVGVNMVDVAEAHGVRVETDVLAAALGLPVVGLVASKRRGLDELIAAAVEGGGSSGRGQPASRPLDPREAPPGVGADRRPCSTAAFPGLSGRLGGPQASGRGRRRRFPGAEPRPQRRGSPSTNCWPSMRTRTSTSPAGATTGWRGWCARLSYSRAPVPRVSPTASTAWPRTPSGGCWWSSRPWPCSST